MSMLSEQRRKTKWIVNPTKKPLWSTDSSGIKFGKELMEKMGWSAGKGLGLNEQGIQEPLKVSFKNDTKGMGFKGNDDNWIEHQDEFNSLLNQLRSEEDSSVVKIPEEEKREVKSLEEKSKTSKARVHYQKFTRGKDLSKYSENDLACIIGTNKMKKEKPKSEEIVETEPKTNGNCETSFGVTTINSGSLQDYFKRKWIINKNKSDESNKDNIDNSTEKVTNENSATYNGQNVEENEEKKSKKKKHKSESEEQLPIEDTISQSDVLESIDKVEKRKRKKKEIEICSDNEPLKKKRRKNSDINGAVEDEISPENDSVLAEPSNLTFENHHLDSIPKKRKKEKNYLNLEIADEDESSCVKEKKKSKKREKSNEETSTLNAIHEIDATNGDECKLSKKKNKKEKILKDAIETAQSCSNEDEPSPTQNDTTEFSLHEKPTKSKKLKKSKKENSEEPETKSTSSDLKEYSCPDETVQKLNILVENDENTSSKKKKKKKDKNEKSSAEELNSLNHKNDQSLAVEVENPIEVESKKKKKKEKKEKLEENNCSNENKESLQENISEEPEKKKKKKKDKKGKSSQNENEENQTVPEGGEEESVKKKKKKKRKLQEENETQQSGQNEAELGKSGTEKIPDGMNSSQPENNPVNDTKTEGEKRIEKLKVNLFGDGTSEKYFPPKGPNERVLKMIKWADISGFRGSNLREVEGYGRKVMYQRQIS